MAAVCLRNSSTPFGATKPLQTKVTCSHLGNFTHFPLVRKTTTKDDVPLLGSIVFFVRWPETGRCCLFCFPCSCSRASAATRRTVRSEERNCGKKREVLGRSRTPSPSAAHRARHRHAPKATDHGVLYTFARERAPARPVFSVFCLHSFTSLATSSISAGYERKNGEGKVKVVKVGLATACDSMRYERLLTFCRVRRKHKVRCFSKMGR